MKKKIILLMILVLTLGIVTGCGGSSSQEESSNKKGKENNDATVKVGNKDVKINRSGSFVEMTFRYPDSALASNVGTYSIIDYMDNNEFVFRIALYFFEGKTIEDVMAGSTLSSVDALPYGEYTWNVYQGKQDDGKSVLNYVTQVGDNSYTVTFISDYDMKDFADAFMKNVNFNK